MNQKNFYFIFINYACENSFSQVDLVRNPEIKGYSVTPFLTISTTTGAGVVSSATGVVSRAVVVSAGVSTVLLQPARHKHSKSRQIMMLKNFILFSPGNDSGVSEFDLLIHYTISAAYVNPRPPCKFVQFDGFCKIVLTFLLPFVIIN